ncbi:MAG TPA: hypothetical protein VMK83_12370 [Gaiellaceae bacterium]|nr:hypothetical protein [Gaiellaceae bacterium]
MNGRLGGSAGIAFALLYFLALFGVLNLPEGVDSDAEVVRLVAGDDERTRAILGVLLLGASGLSFLVFLAALITRLRSAGGGALTILAGAAGTVFVTMLFVATACFGVLPLATSLDELPDEPSAELARVLTQLGFVALLLLGLSAAGTFVLAASVAGHRSRALPRWLVWTGFVIGPLLFFGAFWIPQLLLLVWAAVAGVALMQAGPAHVPDR